MIQSNDIGLEAITLVLHDNFPSMTLNFIETDKANQSYPVVFQFEKVVLDNDERFVLKGKISVCGKPYETGYIEYQYIPGKKWPSNFYRVTYSGNGVLKHMFPLEPHPRFTRDVEDVWAFMRNFKYAEKDNETTINLNGPTNSKKH